EDDVARLEIDLFGDVFDGVAHFGLFLEKAKQLVGEERRSRGGRRRRHVFVCLFCFVLFCFVLFCFVLFCFVLFCFVLFSLSRKRPTTFAFRFSFVFF